jgi:hypothetical protein
MFLNLKLPNTELVYQVTMRSGMMVFGKFN